jgi:hypothetical protein
MAEQFYVKGVAPKGFKENTNMKMPNISPVVHVLDEQKNLTFNNSYDELLEKPSLMGRPKISIQQTLRNTKRNLLEN